MKLKEYRNFKNNHELNCYPNHYYAKKNLKENEMIIKDGNVYRIIKIKNNENEKVIFNEIYKEQVLKLIFNDIIIERINEDDKTTIRLKSDNKDLFNINHLDIKVEDKTILSKLNLLEELNKGELQCIL